MDMETSEHEEEEKGEADCGGRQEEQSEADGKEAEDAVGTVLR